MAIHPDFPGLKAQVIVNGECLEEYDDDNGPQPRTLTKFFEVVSDANFGVRYTIPKGLTGIYGTKVRFNIDGKDVGGRNHPREALLVHGNMNRFDSVTTQDGGMSYRQKFRFSALQIGRGSAFSTLILC